jgi:lipopolysaccharide biosynthesis regulator YciM
MSALSLLSFALIVTALVVGILAGHFGWGKRLPLPFGRLHPDYLTGLDYLVTEQPDRALDLFLRLMEANADTIETHFALGSLYRRRGEVERAIRIHQNLLEREGLAHEHREQALLALAQDYLRAGLLDRAEGLLTQVAEAPRLRASALDALRGVYERQHEWSQALEVYRRLEGIDAAPPRLVAAHYRCEIATLAMERGETEEARRLLREARGEVEPMPRAALLRATIAERQGDRALAVRLVRHALDASPKLLQEELPHLLALVGPEEREATLNELVRKARAREVGDLKRLVFAAITADLALTPALREPIETVFLKDATLRAFWEAARGEVGRIALEVKALLEHAEKYRCNDCGFAGRSFYWHCPACQCWDTFEPYAVVKLR